MSGILKSVCVVVIMATAVMIAWYFFPLPFSVSWKDAARFICCMFAVAIILAVALDILKDELEHWYSMRLRRRIAARN